MDWIVEVCDWNGIIDSQILILKETRYILPCNVIPQSWWMNVGLRSGMLDCLAFFSFAWHCPYTVQFKHDTSFQLVFAEMNALVHFM